MIHDDPWLLSTNQAGATSQVGPFNYAKMGAAHDGFSVDKW